MLVRASRSHRSENGYYLLVLLALVLSCSNKKGSWQLYEEGGSLGFGYFVTQVLAEPVQSLTFNSKGQVMTRGERFNSFGKVGHNRLDSSSVWHRLTLSAEPDGKPFLVGSFRVQGDTLRINPVCYEGCRYNLVRTR